MSNSARAGAPRPQDSPIRFALKASFVGGLLGAWEAAFIVWRDVEVTASRAGALTLALIGFGIAAGCVFVFALPWAALRRAKLGSILLGAKAHPAVLAILGSALVFGAIRLNEGVLPGKTHPLSLACDLALLAAAWAGARFLPAFRIPRPAALVSGAALAAGALLLAFFAARSPARLGPPTAPPPGTPNLLLITMDTTRADRIGVLGGPPGLTPNLDRLAARGTVYRHAYCPMPLTGPSHAAMLTGEIPRRTGITQNGIPLDDRFTTLAEALRGRGYRTAAVVGAFPVSSKLGYAQGFEYFDDNFSPLAASSRLTFFRILGMAGVGRTKAELQRPADRVTAAAVKWLQGEKPPAFFLWVHYFDPHTPYDPPPAFRAVSNHADPQTRLYEGEIAFMDQQLGALLAALDSIGAADRTVVAAVADHGESLGEHDYYYDHGRDVYEPCMRVPLIIFDPAAPASKNGGGGKIIEEPVTITNLYTYLLACTNGTAPSGSSTPLPVGAVFGESWEEGEHMTMAIAEMERQDPLYKYVWKDPAGPEELFDLNADPGETRDIAKETPSAREALRRQVQAFYNRQPPLVRSGVVDATTKKKLKSLGYL